MSRIHSRLKRYSVALPCLLAIPALTYAEETSTPSEPYVIKQSDLKKKEEQLTQNPLMQEVKASIRTLDNDSVEKIAPGRAENPANVKRVEKILSRDQWDYIFPLRAPEYSYENFLKAIGKFPAVCGTYSDGRDSDAICRKGLATMFAHFAQETGAHEDWRPEAEWRQGLKWLREMGWEEGKKGGYNGECNPEVWQGKTWPCGKDKDGDFVSYFGRGAKQLSYNYNYGPFSDAMFGTIRTLLDKPELVADTWLNLASAVFFYVTPQAPKPSMLHVIDGTWKPNAHDIENGLVPGFGVTIQIINGGVECGGPTEIAQGENRISYYKSEADYLKVPIAADEVLGCKNMKQFDEAGAGALPQYWEEDWGWDPNTPTGRTYSCQLVGYQTPFSAFKEGDYQRCVQHFFNVKVVDDSGKEEPVTPTPAPVPEPAPAPAPGDTNIAPVAVLNGPVGEVEGQANVTLNAASSSDANGDKLSYHWLLPNGSTLEGSDRDSISFVAPVVTAKKQFTFSLTVSDGNKSDVATYTLTVIPQVQPLPTPDADKTCADSWVPTKIYYGGENVNWKGKQYLANYWTQNNEPGNPEYTGEWLQWKELNVCK